MYEGLNEFILGVRPNQIREKVVIAPCWVPETVGIAETKKIGDDSCKTWDCVIEDETFTYIVTGVGAAVCMDIVLALKNTICKQILFIGSAGALVEEIKIGDFAVPNGMISAEGASRYIGDYLVNDIYGKCFYAENELQRKLLLCLKNKSQELDINIYDGIGISVESILLQYRHIDEFINLKCAFIDMEASAFLAACNSVNIQGAVVFCISDNTIRKEPLYKVTTEKTNYRKKVRNIIMPLVLKEFVYGFNERD